MRSPVMTLAWRVKLIWVVQCFGFKKQRLVHCVDVTFASNDLGLVFQAYFGWFNASCSRNKDLVHCVDVSFACNDLGLAFQAYLGGSILRNQETKISALR